MSVILLTFCLCWEKDKDKSNLELLTYIDMLLMVEKGIRRRIGQAIHRHTKANNKYIKNYDKTLNHHI